MKGLRPADVTKTRRRVCGTQNAQREEAAAPTPSRQRVRGERMKEPQRMNELPRSMADELGGQGTPANPSDDNGLAMRPAWPANRSVKKSRTETAEAVQVGDKEATTGGFLRQQESGLDVG